MQGWICILKCYKTKEIAEIYENQIGTHDKEFAGTRIRVNATVRLIACYSVSSSFRKLDRKSVV